MKARRALGAGLVFLLGLGCRAAPPEREARVDLASLVPAAEPWAETAELRLGEESAEPALVGGWAAASRRESDFLWGTGDSSSLTLLRADGRPFRLHLAGSAAAAPEGGEPVEVRLEGVEVGRLTLGPAPARHTIEVPEGVARPGANRLELRYPRLPPADPAAAEVERARRRRVAAWRGLRVGAGKPVAGRVELVAGPAPSGPSIRLPAGTGIDFHLRLAGGSRLELEALERAGGARLEADLACEGDPPRIGLLGAVERAAAAAELRAAGLEPSICRLTLRAAPGAEGGSGVVTIRAALVQPAAERAVDLPAQAAPAVRPARNLLVYIVDTLRADRLGVYGYERPLTPAIDAFAAEGVVFEHARAQSSWTRPTVATMLTGLTPVKLGATGRFSRVPAEVETVPERLRAAGFRTAYVTANGNTAAAFGFDQGVDFFRQIRPKDRTEELGGWQLVHAAGREFLDSLAAGERFLLVLHPVEPHAPYTPAAKHRRRFASGADRRLGIRRILTGLPKKRPDPEGAIARQVRDLYDAEVAGTDEGFAALLAELRRAGRLDDTAILFVSDHGEELFEHGNVEHGRTLFEEQLRIPMIWRLPGGAAGGRRIPARVDQLDVAPTLLELAGLTVPPELPGRSLASTLAGGPAPPESSSPAWLERLQWRQESLVDGDEKLIRNLRPRAIAAATEERLYDLGADPGERRPVRDADLRRGLLRAQLRFWTVRSGPALEGGDAVLDDALRAELRALGYLN